MFRLFMPASSVLKKNQNWFLLAFFLFLAGGVYSYYAAGVGSGSLPPLVGEPLENLHKLFALIMESNPVIAALLVFMNNFLSVAQMLLLGALAGLSPVITLMLNGALMGAMAALAAAEGISLWPLFIFGILPHGIFELFAFFLCAGLGLKLGYHCIASPLPGKTRGESFRYIWKETISILPLVAALLLLAAFIEVLVTPRLLPLFM